MNWINIGWWLVYICLAVIFQALFPGLDFMLPGFILAIQEREPVQLGWVALVFILLQEGMGNMGFGGSLLWYSLAVVFFFLGYSLFEVESFLFIFLLSGCLAFLHFVVFSLMASLQDTPFSGNALMEEAVVQALITPFIWLGLRFTRKLVRHADA